MLKKAIKRIICVFIVLAVMLLANGSITAAQPEDANLKIVDISKWNNSIDWQKVSLSVDGVIARIGYRGSVYRDSLAEDDLFYSHYQGCSTYGIPFGCYFYSLAVTVDEAVEEAEWIIETLKKYNCKPDLPIYIDMEDYIVQNETTNRKRTDIAKAFCRTLFENGYYPGVYANKYWLTDLLYPAEFSDCSIWVAQYADTCTYKGSYDMWQYTETGSVNGINGKVDVNHCYKDYSTFIKKYGFNGYPGSVDYKPDDEAVTDTSKYGMYEIVTTSLNVRTGPGTEYLSLGKLKKGSQIYVYGVNNGWGAIRFGNSLGWISLNSNYLKQLSNHNSTEKGIGFYSVNVDTLNVRSGPSTSYSRVDKLNSGEQIYIHQLKDGWGAFYYGDGSTGWVTLEYLTFTGTVNFIGGSAKGGMNHQLIVKGKTAELNKNNFTLNDTEFAGWATSENGKVVYSDGGAVKMGDSNVVLYAVFDSGEFYRWADTVTVEGGVAHINSLMLTEQDFTEKYLELTKSATVTFNSPHKGVAGTGTAVSISNGKRADTFTLCLKGDVNGDSMCDGLDMSLLIELVNSGEKEYSTAQLLAMDLNSDGKLDGKDIEQYKNIIFNGRILK
ncbi:MAG: SH3 domain-containing protein [Clostridia bacterium]|nr:SH3 domain-containing protein [Clostridia bacterium]